MQRLIFTFIFVALAGLYASSEAQDIQSQSGFGTTVALVGDQILVGEPLNARISGLVYVFEKDEMSGSWQEVSTLKADDAVPGDRFGVEIAGDSERLFVSATRADKAGGAVYAFTRAENGEWVQQAKIQPADLAEGDRFGNAVAVDGDRIYVSNVPFDGVGTVYLFEKGSMDSDWNEIASTSGTSGRDKNAFGQALAVSGDELLVGSPSAGNGVVYRFRFNETDRTLEPAGEIVGRQTEDDTASSGRTPPGFPSGDRFGGNIVTVGPYALVSAILYDGTVGTVYGYVKQNGRFESDGKIFPLAGKPQTMFGGGLEVAGMSTVLVGAVGANDGSGVVYVYDYDSETDMFVGATVLTEDGLPELSLYGNAIAADENVMVVGAGRDAMEYGAAYVYEKDPEGSWTLADRLVSELQLAYNTVRGEAVECEDGSAAGFQCSNVDLISFLTTDDIGAPRGIQTNDVWGWTDPDSGKEYAIVGRNDGTSFVDLSDPSNPVYLGELPRTDGSQISTWRDMKTYKNHVFIVADVAGAHGMQIFDLTNLRNIENPPVVFEPETTYDGIYSAHNIVINEETGYAFVVGSSDGGETCGGGSHIINIQDPQNPTFAGCFAHTNTGRQGTGYTHDAQCVIYEGPDERYTGKEICFGANETAISIADLTDKKNPVVLARGDYPTPGYTHQGWLSEDQRYFFVNDELDEINGATDGTRTLIWDVAELDDPILVNEYVSQNRASDHNLYVRGNYMYQSNYVSGLRVIDISDVENPVEVAHFDTVPWGDDRPGFGGSWSNYPYFQSGIIVVTSGEEGVFFLKRSDVDI